MGKSDRVIFGRICARQVSGALRREERLASEGRSLFDDLLQAGHTRTFTGKEQISLVLGDAEAFRLVVNGKPIPVVARARGSDPGPSITRSAGEPEPYRRPGEPGHHHPAAGGYLTARRLRRRPKRP
ncbi:DUF4115 domain-containing protein [Streptomyces exfoliatus]|uniref:DUF4115 domain-containing protein n=1 Tax=Streptomyces exfoliatus TaxID=1905 RepID=UPI003C2F8B45